MPSNYTSRDLAYAGLMGAAALLLPVLFHMFHLGHLFLPMYLPLMTLAFLVRPLPATLTAMITPLLSAAVTGMPPFYPPVAVFMAVELGAMAATIATIRARWPRANAWILLAVTLTLGRVLSFGLMYGFSRAANLPAAAMAGLTFLSGWPGVILMLVTVPPIMRIIRRSAHSALAPSKESHR
jgi:hypothetical protein